MAAGARISGVDGAVTYGGASVVDITKWSITKTMATKEVTSSSSSGGKDFLPAGFYEWNGSFEGFLEEGGVYPAVGAVVSLELFAVTGVEFTGSAIITEMTSNLSVTGGDAVTIAFNFQGTGALTITNSAA